MGPASPGPQGKDSRQALRQHSGPLGGEGAVTFALETAFAAPRWALRSDPARRQTGAQPAGPDSGAPSAGSAWGAWAREGRFTGVPATLRFPCGCRSRGPAGARGIWEAFGVHSGNGGFDARCTHCDSGTC